MSNKLFLAVVCTIIGLLSLVLLFDSYTRCVAEGRSKCGVAHPLGRTSYVFF